MMRSLRRSPARRFAYRLAMNLGIVNVDKMLSELTAKQFMGWECYSALEPFGAFREDHRIAYIVQMLHNVNVKKEHQKPLKDFLLQFDDVEPEEQAPETVDEGIIELKTQEVFLGLMFGSVPPELRDEVASRVGFDPMPNVVTE